MVWKGCKILPKSRQRHWYHRIFSWSIWDYSFYELRYHSVYIFEMTLISDFSILRCFFRNQFVLYIWKKFSYSSIIWQFCLKRDIVRKINFTLQFNNISKLRNVYRIPKNIWRKRRFPMVRVYAWLNLRWIKLRTFFSSLVFRLNSAANQPTTL